MRRNRTTSTEDRPGFRLITCFSIEHNAQRLKVHVWRLSRKPAQRRAALRIRTFKARRRSAQGEGA